MHYYQFNIGDYRRDTIHLSRLEHSIYRDLIDWYFLDEKPIPNDEKIIYRKLRLTGDEEKEALVNVLNDFFCQTDDGWVHGRIEEDIAAYYEAKKNHWGRKLTKERRCAIQANRNAQKISASPAWLSSIHKDQIAAIYSQAAITTAGTGIKHEVDHVIPLRGKTVCGLHVPWNLQVIPYYKNRAKSNKQEEA